MNASLGGVLLRLDGSSAGEALAADTPLEFGSTVKLRLHLAPLKETAEIEGTIRWIKDGAVGVQFGSLRAKEVWALNQLFRELPAA